MISSLKLVNFRAFKEAQFDFAPITIFAGANSSGKSSIIQALNGILQSDGDRSFPFDFITNGHSAQLGSYRNVVHGHNAKNSFGIDLRFEVSGKRYLAGGVYKLQDDASSHLFPRHIAASVEGVGSLRIEWNQKDRKFKLTIDNEYDLAGEDLVQAFLEVIKKEGMSPPEAMKSALSSFRGSDDPVAAMRDYINERLNVSSFKSSSPDPDSSLLEFDARPFVKPIREGINRAMAILRRQVAYVGPVRAHPLRYYSVARQASLIDPFGASISQQLAQWKEKKSARFTEVKQALVQLGLANDLGAELELGEFLKLMIKPRDGAYPDSIADVGFGISQVLPILVSDAGLEQGGTLIVNQPEVHLHPASQAKLANYFVERLGRRRYIIETHSEYLITRLRILVATGRIKEDDVVIYYCGGEADTGYSVVHEVRLAKDGSLKDMPKDFFVTYAADTFDLAMAVMERDADAEE